MSKTGVAPRHDHVCMVAICYPVAFVATLPLDEAAIKPVTLSDAETLLVCIHISLRLLG